MEELCERQGAKGVPTAKELVHKLKQIHVGVESEHAKLMKSELEKIHDFMKREIARVDIRINNLETLIK